MTSQTVVEYFKELLTAENFVQSVEGLGVIVGDTQKSFPALQGEDEPLMIDFDNYNSMLFFLQTAAPTLATTESEEVAGEYTVEWNNTFQLVIYTQVSEAKNCESYAQSIALQAMKAIIGRQSQFEAVHDFQECNVTTGAMVIDKVAAWNLLYNGVDSHLKDRDVLVILNFTVQLIGNADCFVVDVCSTPSGYTYNFDTPEVCQPTFTLQIQGDGTATYSETDLVGKEVLQVTTDGLVRNHNPDYTPWQVEFTSATGTLAFGSDINSTQLIQVLYK